LLTGKYRKAQPLPENSRGKDAWGPSVFSDANLDIVESLIRFATARGHSLLELAICWLAAQDTVVSVIAGAKTPEQAKANGAASSWRLTKEELSQIDAIVLQTA
jgi:aryl-alcohol dehydrogenase-like predicted oxidoreductase